MMVKHSGLQKVDKWEAEKVGWKDFQTDTMKASSMVAGKVCAMAYALVLLWVQQKVETKGKLQVGLLEGSLVVVMAF
jgi:hypothetical protein